MDKKALRHCYLEKKKASGLMVKKERASSGREAVDKAMNAGLVGDWEDPEAYFWTEELPDVFS